MSVLFSSTCVSHRPSPPIHSILLSSFRIPATTSSISFLSSHSFHFHGPFFFSTCISLLLKEAQTWREKEALSLPSFPFSSLFLTLFSLSDLFVAHQWRNSVWQHHHRNGWEERRGDGTQIPWASVTTVSSSSRILTHCLWIFLSTCTFLSLNC